MNYKKETLFMEKDRKILNTMKMLLNLSYQKKHGKIVNIKKREMLDIMKEQQLIYLLIN